MADIKENPELIVIENSACCNLRCKACPTVYAPDYPRTFMKPEVFDRIMQHINPDIIPKCALMGWGEPLLDPLYFERLKKLKQAGYLVGTTSNLILLNEEMTGKILDCGLDHLGISVDTNHLESSGMTVEQMMERIGIVFESIRKKSARLTVGINIILFKSGLSTAMKILEEINIYPASSVGIAPLIMIPSRDLYKELLTKQEVIAFRKEVENRYGQGIYSFQYMEDTAPAGDCRSGIWKNIYVNYQGYVSPCCVLAMKFPNMTFQGDFCETKTLYFGNLRDMEFEKIWNSESYRKFREIFFHHDIPQQCYCCNSWRNLI